MPQQVKHNMPQQVKHNMPQQFKHNMPQQVKHNIPQQDKYKQRHLCQRIVNCSVTNKFYTKLNLF